MVAAWSMPATKECWRRSTALAARSALPGCCGSRRQASISTVSGVHAGEVDIVGDDVVSGTSVDIATRLAALALPGELLASRTVKDLVAGSGICFADRGTHRLPEVPDEWSVFAVPAAERTLGRDPGP
jgi:class 3 adenylate cyclase